MPVPSSGQLRLRNDIAAEAYRTPTQGSNASSNISLRALSATAGFSTPDAMSEFFGYSSVGLGLGPVLYSEDLTSLESWRNRNVSLTYYSGCVVRVVWHYVSGSSYTGDYQLDNITVTNTGIGTYTFESSTHSFETSTADVYSYNPTGFSPLATGGTSLRWNRDGNNTSSGGTGLDPNSNPNGGGIYHVYAEVSGSGYPSKNFWLKSPEIWLPNNSSSKFLNFDFAAYGNTVGRIEVYVDVISIHNTGPFYQY